MYSVIIITQNYWTTSYVLKVKKTKAYKKCTQNEKLSTKLKIN